MTRRFLIALMAVLGVLGVGLTPAQAVPSLQLFDGTTTVTITDGGVGDANGAAGAITFIGSLGDWTLNVSTGASGPAPAPPYPHMDLNSLNSSATGSSTLWIWFTDTGFSSVPGLTGLIGGTLSSTATLTYNLWVDPSNVPFATVDQLFGMSFGPGGAFSALSPHCWGWVPPSPSPRK